MKNNIEDVKGVGENVTLSSTQNYQMNLLSSPLFSAIDDVTFIDRVYGSPSSPSEPLLLFFLRPLVGVVID